MVPAGGVGEVRMAQSRSLVVRLAVRALVLSFDPDLSTAAQAVCLARLCRGDIAAIEGAVRRIEAGPNGRGALAAQAIESLQVAAATLAVPPAVARVGAHTRDVGAIA